MASTPASQCSVCGAKRLGGMPGPIMGCLPCLLPPRSGASHALVITQCSCLMRLFQPLHLCSLSQRRLPRLCHRPRVPRGAGGRPHCAGAGARVSSRGWVDVPCRLYLAPRAAPLLWCRCVTGCRALEAGLEGPRWLPATHTRCSTAPTTNHTPFLPMQNGDTIRIDAEKRSMDILNVDDAELQRRCVGSHRCGMGSPLHMIFSDLVAASSRVCSPPCTRGAAA